MFASKFRNMKKFLFTLLLIFFVSPVWAKGGSVQLIPSQAVSAGYNQLTFSSTFYNDVDFNETYTQGWQWYVWNFFGNAHANASTINSDGSLLLSPVTPGVNTNLATAAVANGSFVGTAFGGGAYIEAQLKFDPATVNTANGWPSFWSMSIEHLANLSTEGWVGQVAGYIHFIENDFMEWLNNSNNIYVATLHDWYGVYQTTCPASAYCNSQQASFLTTGASSIGTGYHTYGMLWIPATSGTSGSVQYYFDGNAIGSKISWTQFTTQSPPPTGQPWRFGIMDQQHLVTIIGTGIAQPLTVKYVKVWQKDTSGNLTQ